MQDLLKKLKLAERALKDVVDDSKLVEVASDQHVMLLSRAKMRVAVLYREVCAVLGHTA